MINPAFRPLCLLMILVFTLPLTVQAEEVCPRVDHSIELLRAGTRSEARQGFLDVDCARVPDTFERVVVDGQEFVFLQRSMLWGDDGYHPSGKTVEPETGEEAIADQDLEQGWSLGAPRPEGTPANWILVEWVWDSAWVDPAHIDDLVRAEAIENIERQAGEMGIEPTEGRPELTIETEE